MSQTLTLKELVAKFPTRWHYLKQPSVGIVLSSCSMLELGKKVNYSKSGKNASIIYSKNEIEMLKKAENGTLIQIEEATNKYRVTTVYKKINEEAFIEKPELRKKELNKNYPGKLAWVY